MTVVVHHHRRLIKRLDQISQRIQLGGAHLVPVVVSVIDCAACKLQQLVGEGCSAHRLYLLTVDLQQAITLEVLVGLQFWEPQAHTGINQHRHLKVVSCLHGDSDIADLASNLFLRALDRHPLIDRVAVVRSRCHVLATEARDVSAKSVAVVQQSDLRPQILKTVG